MFDYQTVIFRNLPQTFPLAISSNKPIEPINTQLAHQQHQAYVTAISQLVPNQISILADDLLPDCVFIEDVAVVIGSVALINNLGHPSRIPEVAEVKLVLGSTSLTIISMVPPATLDGGDVLVMGKNIFVGLSNRTNRAGYTYLAGIFPNHNVWPIHIMDCLHLKSLISALDENTIVYVDTVCGESIVSQIKTFRLVYLWVAVPDIQSANVLRVHDTVFIQDGFEASEKILENEIISRDLKCIKLSMGEFIKADGALTCCSILF